MRGAGVSSSSGQDLHLCAQKAPGAFPKNPHQKSIPNPHPSLFSVVFVLSSQRILHKTTRALLLQTRAPGAPV